MGRRVWAGVGALLLIGLLGYLASLGFSVLANRHLEDVIRAAYLAEAGRNCDPLEITYPFDEAVFPPEAVEPNVRWRERRAEADAWLVTIEFADGTAPVTALSRTTEWTPSPTEWRGVKARSVDSPATITILGVNQAAPDKLLSAGTVRIRTSPDEVGAPLFFREVNLPFQTAVRDPAQCIRWRFGPISSREPPPIVLEKLPACGNCHSFPRDGATLAMEVSSGDGNGDYAVASVSKDVVMDAANIVRWNDYKKEDGERTFGLLCQISPNGRYVAGTVKDRAVAYFSSDLMFSQLFFPIKGYLVIYDREAKTFHALPGADDPEYVQTNATWSPDGKYIVFARSRSKAFQTEAMRNLGLLIADQKEAEAYVKEGRTFLFDLYRIPFNGGKGGEAEPLAGASNNGMSNYFAKYSPDGKWIVFCKAKSFMLLQPDSELYIIPAEGGEPRRLRANTWRMNSWHTWSPNGRWLAFSSKANGPYTQLFLTHIDEQGESTPAVELANFTVPGRAANIPEFVNQPADAIRKIRVEQRP